MKREKIENLSKSQQILNTLKKLESLKHELIINNSSLSNLSITYYKQVELESYVNNITKDLSMMEQINRFAYFSNSSLNDSDYFDKSDFIEILDLLINKKKKQLKKL